VMPARWSSSSNSARIGLQPGWPAERPGRRLRIGVGPEMALVENRTGSVRHAFKHTVVRPPGRSRDSRSRRSSNEPSRARWSIRLLPAFRHRPSWAVWRHGARRPWTVAADLTAASRQMDERPGSADRPGWRKPPDLDRLRDGRPGAAAHGRSRKRGPWAGWVGFRGRSTRVGKRASVRRPRGCADRRSSRPPPAHGRGVRVPIARRRSFRAAVARFA